MPRFEIRLAAVVTLALASGCAQEASPVNLAWQNVAPRYATFDQIRPVLLNNSDRVIFLSRFYPTSSARLERLSEATGDWEAGDWGITCGTVAKATVPNRIKSRAERSIDVNWHLSTDDWDHPKYFIVANSREEHPIEGRYRFVLDYAFEPWTLIHHPSQIYEIVSPEFVLQP